MGSFALPRGPLMPHPWVILLVALLPAAPVPKDKKPVYYAATKVGDKREYRRADGKALYTLHVTKVEENPKGGLLVTEAMESEGLPPRPSRLLAVTEDGIAIKEELRPRFRRLDPPHYLVKPLAKPGDKWEWEGKRAGDKPRPANFRALTLKYSAGEKEKVTVPAGTFECVRVEMENTRAESKEAFWYATGVGLVKRVQNDRPGVEPIVLHSFTPGKGEVTPDDTNRPRIP